MTNDEVKEISHCRLSAAGNPGKQSFLLPVFITVSAFIVLAFHANYYMPFISDDALISLRYAGRLLEGHGLTWTEGIPVEGYTNLLWVLLVSVLGWFGFDLIDGVRILGLICTFAAITALVYRNYTAGSLPMISGLLTIVLAVPIAVWTIGGLEQPLIAALLAWSLVLFGRIMERDSVVFRDMFLPSLFLGLLCITRPDNVIFAGALALAIIFLKGLNFKSVRISLQMLSMPVLFSIGQLGFRLFYYGEWLPNTALVKITLSTKHFLRGVDYMMKGVLAFSPLFEIAAMFVILLLLNKSKRAGVVFLMVPGLIWSAYVIVIGGDIFPAWRHFVPLTVIVALIISYGMEWVGQHLKTNLMKLLVSIFLISTFGWFFYHQSGDITNRRAVDERWQWNGKVIGLLLKNGFGKYSPTVAVTAAGSLPYWSELPSIDMLGLNDYYLPRHPPEDFGSGTLAHELGDGQYVLGRKPDLIIFRGPKGGKTAKYLSGRQMQEDPEFFKLYTPVIFEGKDPHTFQSIIWVRRYSEKIGIKKTEKKITVPAYLINGNPETVAYLDQDNQFVISLSAGRTANIKNLKLLSGKWRIDLDSSSGVNVTAHTIDKELLFSEKPAPVIYVFGKAGDYNLDLSLEVIDSEQTEVRKLILTRLSD